MNDLLKIFLLFYSTFLFGNNILAEKGALKNYKLIQPENIIQLESLVNQKKFNAVKILASKVIKGDDKETLSTAYWALGVSQLSNKPDSALHYFTKAKQHPQSKKLSLQIANAIANYYDIKGEVLHSKELFLKLEKQVDKENETFLPVVYNSLCISYRVLGQYDSAIYYGMEGLKIAENNNQQIDIKRLYNSLAINFAVQDDFTNAKKYFLKSLELAIGNQDSVGISKAYSNMTQLMIYDNEIDSAKYYLKLTKSFNIGNETTLDIVYQYGLLGDVYMEQANYDEAITNYQSALVEVENTNFKTESIPLMLKIAECYLSLNQLNLLTSMLKKAASIVEETDNQDFKIKVLQLYRGLNVAQHDYQKAYNNQIQIDSLNKAKYSREKAEIVQELNTKYQTEKKEQQINNLKKEAEIVAVKASQKNILWIASGLVVLLLVIIGIAWFRTKVALEKSRVLEANQKFLRSRINPHFLFNALTSIRSYLYEEKNAKLAITYISNFASLMRKILEHSGIENVSLQEELEALSSYVDLQKLRFDNDFDYQVNIAEQIDDEEIYLPPLLLQPYIENAIEHGIGSQKGGKLVIDINTDNDTMNISITDNGEERVEISDRVSVSGDIQKSRFKIFNKNKFEHYSQSQKILTNSEGNKTGYQVLISIPIIRK